MLIPQIFPDHEAVSRFACEWLCERMHEKPASLLCLASGGTPERTYQLLAEQGAAERALFQSARLLKLDEWGGLPLSDPATCDQHLRRTLVDPLRLVDRYVGFDSQAADAAAECTRIAAWLAANGPIDLCVLGLGVNGHLGFNEPGDALEPHAHVATLSPASQGHAMMQRKNEKPTYGLTLGMADLLQSRRVLLLVTGGSKREPLRRLLSGRIDTRFPASLLQLHNKVLVLCDVAAGS